MPSGVIYIEIPQLTHVINELKGKRDDIIKRVDETLSAGAVGIEKAAKVFAPKDLAGLAGSIRHEITEPLKKHVTVNAFYAAYIEFGTGSYAAAYVGTLPQEWQQLAAQFRGRSQKGGTAYDFWLNLTKWVHRHSRFSEGKITGTHSEKTGRRKGSKPVQQAQDEAAAYALMIAIFKKGIRQHPFLYPAYEDERNKIIENVRTVLRSI
jgi:HK97 gp10 family phage protein